jgi:hypothetical protein
MKKFYTTLTLVSILFNISQATIHYTQVYEYAYPTARFYDIDLDGDNDFSFTSGNSDYVVEGLKPTCFYAAEGTSGSKPKAYQQGAAMGTYHWYNGIGSLILNSGNFNGVSKYLMIKFNDTNNNTYYGWVLLISSNGGGSLMIKEYAYQDTPNQTIIAGEVETLSIEDFSVNAINVFVQNGTIQLSQTGNYSAVLSNLNGQQILSVADVTNQMDVSALPRGVYILSLRDKMNRYINRKIVL